MNIKTSYIRIKKRNGTHLTEGEIDYIFSEIVNVNEKFGSYWVRIVKKYRENEKCLDIQFGGSKRVSNILTEKENYNLYHVVERESNEGGKDEIFEYELNENESSASRTRPRPCKYQFDRIIIESEVNWLEKEGAEQNSSHSQILKLNGTYLCANDKGFVDLFEDSKYYGPCLGYDEKYQYDYFVLTETENLKFLIPSFLKTLQENKFERMPDNSEMHFLCNYRKVLTIQKFNTKIKIQSADYWDNCIDEKYLQSTR